MRRASSPALAVIDASVLVALCAHEPHRFEIASRTLSSYAADGTRFYAPRDIVAEVMYALCLKAEAGLLPSDEHTKAIVGLRNRMRSILPPPDGEVSLIDRANLVRSGFGCGRSSDSLYIALAERLGHNGPTELVTFDAEMLRQIKNAPTVNARVL